MAAVLLLALGAEGSAADANAGEIGLLPFTVRGDAVPEPLGQLRGDAARGKAVVLDRRSGNCLICHAFPAVAEPFQGEIGPAMRGLGARLSPGQIRLRLIDVGRVNPAALMPSYYRVDGLTDVAPEYAGKPVLTAQQIEDVVAYLSGLVD